jgi:hypothetical protein
MGNQGVIMTAPYCSVGQQSKQTRRAPFFPLERCPFESACGTCNDADNVTVLNLMCIENQEQSFVGVHRRPEFHTLDIGDESELEVTPMTPVLFDEAGEVGSCGFVVLHVDPFMSFIAYINCRIMECIMQP